MEQIDFAAKLGIKQTFLSEIETNKKTMSRNIISQIAINFPGISLDWLIKGTGNMLIIVSSDSEDPFSPLMAVNPAVLYERIITEKDKQLLYLGKKLKKYEPDSD